MRNIVNITSMVKFWITLFKDNILEYLCKSIVDHRLFTDITVVCSVNR